MKRFVFIILIISAIFLLATSVLAQTKLMVNIPGAPGEISDFSEYIKYLYLFGLAIVGVVAMLFIIIGGIRYMAAAGNQTAISEAKSQITAAILGLVLVLTSWLILNTINPELVSLKKLTVEPIDILGDNGDEPTGKSWLCGYTQEGGCQEGEEAFAVVKCYSKEKDCRQYSCEGCKYDCKKQIKYGYGEEAAKRAVECKECKKACRDVTPLMCF